MPLRKVIGYIFFGVGIVLSTVALINPDPDPAAVIISGLLLALGAALCGSGE